MSTCTGRTYAGSLLCACFASAFAVFERAAGAASSKLLSLSEPDSYNTTFLTMVLIKLNIVIIIIIRERSKMPFVTLDVHQCFKISEGDKQAIEHWIVTHETAHVPY